MREYETQHTFNREKAIGLLNSRQVDCASDEQNAHVFAELINEKRFALDGIPWQNVTYSAAPTHGPANSFAAKPAPEQ